ncbi:MAG: hypothetical protein GY861_27365, partial [bacterium]|nr:hypothetical protein [bacterium]
GDAIFFSSDFSPKATSTLNMRLGLDLVGPAQAQVTFTKTPTFFVYLPIEFDGLLWELQPSSNYKPTMTITPYTIDTAGTVAKGTAIKMGETKNSGNIVWATASTDVVFTTNFKYFDVSVAGLRSPGNNVTTSAFNFAILSAAADVLAKTWTSSINQVNNLAALTYTTIPKPTDTNSPASSLIYTTYPGLKFGARAKWDANYNNNNKQNGNAGRYMSGYWVVTTNTSLAVSSPELCDISLDAGSVFSIPTGVTKWVLNTTLIKVKVKFGATCTGSVAGRYFTFWSAKCANFYSLPPVIITLTTINKGTAIISWEGVTSSTATTFPGGNLLINLSVFSTDVAVDAITATFKEDAKNSGSSLTVPELKANAVKVQGKFESQDTTVTAVQKFTITINNTCFTLSLSAVSADLSATAPVITKAVDTKAWCVFKNPKTDTFIIASTPPKLNGMRWVCTPTPTFFPL